MKYDLMKFDLMKFDPMKYDLMKYMLELLSMVIVFLQNILEDFKLLIR